MGESPRTVDGLGLEELKSLLVQALEDAARLRAENDALREEMARLKGLNGRPKLKPSGMEKATETPATHVTRRKVSGGTRSDTGGDCRDKFLGLMKTCAKQTIRFWDSLGARLGVPGAPNVPRLPDLIRLAKA